MQVRFANRQDEKGIRELAEALSIKESASFDLKGADSDLVNIDANYFGRHGLFLVVEDEGAIKGFAGAKEKSEDTLEITRFSLDETVRSDELEAEMLRVIVEFAPRLLYSGIECNAAIKSAAFKQYKFELKNSDNLHKLPVKADF